jgi:hypothetical protein
MRLTVNKTLSFPQNRELLLQDSSASVSGGLGMVGRRLDLRDGSGWRPFARENVLADGLLDTVLVVQDPLAEGLVESLRFCRTVSEGNHLSNFPTPRFLVKMLLVLFAVDGDVGIDSVLDLLEELLGESHNVNTRPSTEDRLTSRTSVSTARRVSSESSPCSFSTRSTCSLSEAANRA